MICGIGFAHPAWPLLQCWAYGLGGTSSWDVNADGLDGQYTHTLVNGGQKEEYERAGVFLNFPLLIVAFLSEPNAPRLDDTTNTPC